MKKTNNYFTLLCFITFSLGFLPKVQAQESFTLQQCIDSALNRSLQVTMDTYDLEKTKANIQQQYSALLPSISGSASYQYDFQVSTTVIPAGVFGGPAGTYEAVKFGAPQSESAAVTLNQNLFNAATTIALKAAKVEINLNKLQIKSNKEDLVYNVSATYYNIQSVMKQIELSNEILVITEALLANMQQQLKAGLATQTDVDRLTVTRDNDKASLQSNENNKEKYYNMLKTFMNLPLSKNIVVLPFTDNEASSVLLEIPAFDPESKTNYQQIMENKDISILQRKNIRAGYLPSLALDASYGLYGNYVNANPFRSLNDRYYPSSYFGLKLTIPVFDGFSIKYQMKQKYFEIKKYEVQAEQTTQQNKQDLANAYADFKSNFITYQNQRRNLELAQKVMKDINAQYKSGLVKVSDFINTSSDLQTAQNNFVNALINIKQAELNLKKAQGTLLKN